MTPGAELEPSLPSDAGRPTVIYVMGAGRSGSTILGVALGNCENVFYAGELDKWLLRSGRPKLQDAERTRFWRTVRERMVELEPPFGPAAHRYLERSSALFRVRGRRARRRLRARYRAVTEELYRAVASAAGATHVVDSSHYPLRARELQALEGIDLFLLLLVREPRSVRASFAREDVDERRFGAATTTAYLWLTNLLSVWVFLRQPRTRRIMLRHEDFLAQPEGVLRCLLDHAGAAAQVPNVKELRTGLPLHGNRLIRSEVVALRRAEGSPAQAPRAARTRHHPWWAALLRLGPIAVPRPASQGRSADASTPVPR
jgi:Sulfotransferase family